MNLSELNELYEIYREKNSTSFFSRFSFFRQMRNPQTVECFKKLDKYFESNYITLTKTELERTFINFLSHTPIEQMGDLLSDINISSKKDNESVEHTNQKLLSLLGFENFPSNCISEKFIKIAFNEDKNTLQNLFNQYLPTIFEMHLRTNEDALLMTSPLNAEHHTLEEFTSLLQSNSIDGKNLRKIAFLELTHLLETYSLDELKNNQDDINKDIKLGLDKRYKRSDTYKKYQSTFREMAQYIDENDLELLEHSREYFKQINGLIRSGRFSNDELSRLKECKYIMEAVNISNPNELLKRFQKVPNFVEIFSDAVQDYEITYREDIVKNITEIHPESIQKITIMNEKNLNQSTEIDGILIDSLEKMGNPLIHAFGNTREANAYNTLRYTSQKIIEKNIQEKNKTDTELAELITNLYNVMSQVNFNTRFSMESNDFQKSSEYSKLLNLLNDEDKEFANSQASHYINQVANPAQINQMEFNNQEIGEKIAELVNPEIAEVFSPRNDVPLCTMVMQTKSLQNIQSFIGTTALIFDKNGINAEDIILSSKDNLEINTHTDSVTDFDKIEDVQRSSASLETLKTERGISATTHRSNSEIDLNRENIKPSAVMYYGSRLVNNNSIEKIAHAMETAQSLKVPFVFIDSDALVQNFEKQTLQNRKKDEMDR